MKRLSITLCLLAQSAWAAPPSVVTDIAPIQGLVWRVMDGVGQPDVILPPGASPHGHALRPSQARALAGADLIVWVGPDLTPWLGDAMVNLAPEAAVLTLMEQPGTHQVDWTGEGGDDHAGHDHGDHDPHGWLDPSNGALWLDLIADRLSALDPENAAAYAANAQAGLAEIEALTAEIRDDLAGADGVGFVWGHAGYGHFEAAFDLRAMDVVADGDAAPPGAGHLSDLRRAIVDGQVSCILQDQETTPARIATLTEGSETRVERIDPFGVASGPDHYLSMMRDFAGQVSACLGPDRS